MTHFAILLDGPCAATEPLRAAVAGARAIAADGGMRHAASLELAPELWVGEFDGAPADLVAAHAGVPRDTHPAAKNATDGVLAVEAALARGARRLTMVGALGGARLDHALGTLASGVSVAERGVDVAMTDGRQWALPLLPDGPLRIEAPGPTVSVVGLTDLSGLTLGGVRWPLVGADVPFGSSLTLSNEATGTVTASLAGGRALLLHGPGDGGGGRGGGRS